jgi:hypothetical protein
MERLKKILDKLNNVDYYNMKQQQPEEQVQMPEDEKAIMGQALPGMEPPPAPMPNLKPESMDSMDSAMNTDLMAELPSMQPAEGTPTISPFNKKLKYLDMMNKKQGMNNPGLKPKKILAGGGLDYGPGIF